MARRWRGAISVVSDGRGGSGRRVGGNCSCSNHGLRLLLATRGAAHALHLTLQILLGAGLVPGSEEHEGTSDRSLIGVGVARRDTAASLASLLRESSRESASLSVPSVVSVSSSSTVTTTVRLAGVVCRVIAIILIASSLLLLSASHRERGVNRAVVHFVVGRERGVERVLRVGSHVLLLAVRGVLKDSVGGSSGGRLNTVGVAGGGCGLQVSSLCRVVLLTVEVVILQGLAVSVATMMTTTVRRLDLGLIRLVLLLLSSGEPEKSDGDYPLHPEQKR
ncbi:hypothetical protein PFISCL1PPCAC_24463, partial [Pristionchus fissidentatus]